MPLFFFDIHDGSVVRDEDGLDLPDLDAAIREAVKALPSFAGDISPRGDDRQHFTVVIRNEDDRPVYTAALSFCGTRL